MTERHDEQSWAASRKMIRDTRAPCGIRRSHLSKGTNEFPEEQNEHLAIYLGGLLARHSGENFNGL
jgi:hypothetical protein